MIPDDSPDDVCCQPPLRDPRTLDDVFPRTTRVQLDPPGPRIPPTLLVFRGPISAAGIRNLQESWRAAFAGKGVAIIDDSCEIYQAVLGRWQRVGGTPPDGCESPG